MTEDELNALIAEQKENAPAWYQRSEKHQTLRGREELPAAAKRRLKSPRKKSNYKTH